MRGAWTFRPLWESADGGSLGSCLVRSRRTHLRVVLHGGMVQAGENADSDEAPVREVDGGEGPDITASQSVDSVDSVANCGMVLVGRQFHGGEGWRAL